MSQYTTHSQKVKIRDDDDDVLEINADGSINVLGPLTDTELRAADVSVLLNSVSSSLTDSEGYLQTSALTEALNVPAGLVVGHYAVNKFGRTLNADDGVLTDIWDAPAQPIWLAPTAARIHAIVSTSDVDGKTGAPTAAGARTIQVYGLKTWDLAETSEVVTLDGTTAVNTAQSYVIIHRMKVLTSGASGPNVGTITATAAAPDSTVTARITAGTGQTLMAIYGIPSTRSAYMTGYYCSIERDSPTGATIEGNLKYSMDIANNKTTYLVKHTWTQTVGGADIKHLYNPYNKFTGPGILKLMVTSDQNNTHCDGGFDLIVRDN